MIRVQNLSKSFKTGSGKVVALHNISFSVPDSSSMAIIGKSGSGKSTLLSLLGALDSPDAGLIDINGQDIVKLRSRKLTSYRCRSIGFVFQQFNLIPNLTAVENVMLPMEFAHVSARRRKLRAIQVLNQVGITDDKQKRKPSRLSGGEQQRVAIARALVNKPGVILADEPTGNLDSATGLSIIKLLRDLVDQEHTTVIIVTHDASIAKQCDSMIRVVDGQIIKD
jgi:putative ABC transport system ATP-binding protein